MADADAFGSSSYGPALDAAAEAAMAPAVQVRADVLLLRRALPLLLSVLSAAGCQAGKAAKHQSSIANVPPHLQECGQLLGPADLLEALLGMAAASPRFAVTVAGGSLLGGLLQAIEHLAGSAETEGQVGCMLCAVDARGGMLRCER